MVTRTTTAAKKTATKKPAKVVPRKNTAAQTPRPVVETIEVVALPVVVAEKQKLIRDSFTMPKAEYELIAELKGRLLLLSKATKKSELLRAGIVLLSTLSDVGLLSAVARVPSLKTGRPKKAKTAVKGTRKKV